MIITLVLCPELAGSYTPHLQKTIMTEKCSLSKSSIVHDPKFTLFLIASHHRSMQHSFPSFSHSANGSNFFLPPFHSPSFPNYTFIFSYPAVLPTLLSTLHYTRQDLLLPRPSNILKTQCREWTDFNLLTIRTISRHTKPVRFPLATIYLT